MHLVACYGSLKKGFYNHPSLGLTPEFLGESSIRGVMYWNGAYPKLYMPALGMPGIEPNLARTHTLEVYRISVAPYNWIRLMELGAGYEEAEVETKWGKAKIYFMPYANFRRSDEWIEGYTHELVKK